MCLNCLSLRVSIAKAIPSLLEHHARPVWRAERRRFNRESDSVTVGAPLKDVTAHDVCRFQSRKRFRHCWSQWSLPTAQSRMLVSIAKAIPSLLEHKLSPDPYRYLIMFQSRKRFRHCWSYIIACDIENWNEFQSRKRFRHCWSSNPVQCHRSHSNSFQSRKRFRHCWSMEKPASSAVFYLPVSIAKAIPSLLERPSASTVSI